jgi:hypothetical protein
MGHGEVKPQRALHFSHIHDGDYLNLKRRAPYPSLEIHWSPEVLLPA